MQLWLAGLLALLGAAALILILAARRREKKGWMTAAAAAAAALLLPALLAYIVLTLIFTEAAGTRPADAAESLPVLTSAAPAASPSPTPALPEAMAADADLPVSEASEAYPDVLGLRDAEYEEIPTFSDQDAVAQYALWNLLNGNTAFEFNLTRDTVPDEGAGYAVLSGACDAAMSYYLFGAYSVYDMYTEDLGDPESVRARVRLTYPEPELDAEARAEALEFVLKNPVPADGFGDYASEKAYALKIHDYIAKKVTYSPIGYDPEGMFGMDSYEALQEAYNVLAEDQSTAVCAGYARAFALIAQYAGINAAWVMGNETETESHAWNVIYPCDGSAPVLVDVTWDDGNSADTPGQTAVSDRYFYLPLTQDTEHVPSADMASFLALVNGRQVSNAPY